MLQELLAKLKEIVPDTVFNVQRKVDHWYKWDGDGPDPRTQHLDPYDITVTATTIVNGEFVTDEVYMTGFYMEHNEEIYDCNGYLPQMIKDVIEALDNQLRIVGFPPSLPTHTMMDRLEAVEEFAKEYVEEYNTKE